MDDRYVGDGIWTGNCLKSEISYANDIERIIEQILHQDILIYWYIHYLLTNLKIICDLSDTFSSQNLTNSWA